MTNTATIQGRGWPRSANLNAYAQSIPYGQYQSNAQYFTNDVYNENFDPSLNGLSQSMAGMMLQGADYGGAPKQNIAGTASGVANLAGVPASPANSGMFYALPNGGFVYSNVHGTQKHLFSISARLRSRCRPFRAIPADALPKLSEQSPGHTKRTLLGQWLRIWPKKCLSLRHPDALHCLQMKQTAHGPQCSTITLAATMLKWSGQPAVG